MEGISSFMSVELSVPLVATQSQYILAFQHLTLDSVFDSSCDMV